MHRIDTEAEVTAFLERFAVAEKVRSLPPMTEAEIAAAERAFAETPEIPGMVDVDAEAVFGIRDEFADIFGDEFTGMYGDDGGQCDPTSPDGF